MLFSSVSRILYVMMPGTHMAFFVRMWYICITSYEINLDEPVDCPQNAFLGSFIVVTVCMDIAVLRFHRHRQQGLMKEFHTKRMSSMREICDGFWVNKI